MSYECCVCRCLLGRFELNSSHETLVLAVANLPMHRCLLLLAAASCALASCVIEAPATSACSGRGDCVQLSSADNRSASADWTCVCQSGWTGRADFINRDGSRGASDCGSNETAITVLWSLSLVAMCSCLVLTTSRLLACMRLFASISDVKPDNGAAAAPAANGAQGTAGEFDRQPTALSQIGRAHV